MVTEDIAAGRLLHALPQWQLPEGGIYAVFPSARFRAPRVSAFVELLASMIKLQVSAYHENEKLCLAFRAQMRRQSAGVRQRPPDEKAALGADREE